MPLIDLAALQAAISSGRMDQDDVWLATRKCERDLQNLAWTVRDLLDCIACLAPYQARQVHDFKHSEWCQSSNGDWFPCDVYKIPYDEARKCRSSLGLEIYLKFSITENGDLTLIIISSHL